MLQCWTRSDKSSHHQDVPDSWLADQLKFTRDQLDKKSRDCDQYAAELRELKDSQSSHASEEVSQLREELNRAREQHQEELRIARKLHDEELQRLQSELSKERELHQEAEQLLQKHRESRDHKVKELQQELNSLGDGLEQKEADMLSIQFGMVELQNRLKDTDHLVVENADAFQKASEELAQREEELDNAMFHQKELVKERNSVAARLEGQVKQLSRELDHFKALQAQDAAVAQRLETEKEALVSELQRTRSQAVAELSLCRDEGQQKELAAAQEQARLRDELREVEAALHASAHHGAAACKVRTEGSIDEFEHLPALVQNKDGGARFAYTSAHDGGFRDSPEHCAGLGVDHKEGQLLTPAVPNVLIAAEIELGSGSRATLTVAPWQTRSDFDGVVQEFLSSHRIKPVFEKAMVQYLEEIEREATTFPLMVKASLTEIYSRYG